MSNPDYISLKLINAEHTYLLDRGWIYRPNTKHYSPPDNRGFVFRGDGVFRHTALEVQKSIDKYEGLM